MRTTWRQDTPFLFQERAMSEKKYWIYVSGTSDAAVLYNRDPKDGGKPELWIRSGCDEPQSAKGLHLGMLFQGVAGGRVIPPNHSFEGTQEDAFRVLRQDQAVANLIAFFRLMSNVGVGGMSAEEAIDWLQEAESLLDQPGVVVRVKELGFIPRLLEDVRLPYGEAGVGKFRERIQAAGASKIENLFFGE